MAWRLTQRRILLPGLGERVWFLGKRVYRWWDGPFLRKVPMAPPTDMFWGSELVGDELGAAERGFPIGDLLEGSHLPYMTTLVPQLIDVTVWRVPPPPTQADPSQPPAFGDEPVRTGQGGSSSRVASSDLVCF